MQNSGWITRGFDAFRRGTFGNGGQNLYVSREGVLQRIHLHDINADGWFDLLFCNSQNHWEIPPSYLYQWNDGDFTRREIPTCGANASTVADLNGDGRADLVTGLWYDGTGFEVNARLFYDHGQGWSEAAIQYLPMPRAIAVAAGDFNGDGRVDVAFAHFEGVRIFQQTDLGLEMKGFKDLAIKPMELAAADLDGDGSAELLARFATGLVRIYWGGPDGINPQRFTDVNVQGDALGEGEGLHEQATAGVEWVQDAAVQVKVVRLGGRQHIFVGRSDAAWFVPIEEGRRLGDPVRIECPMAWSVVVADVDGDGHDDLVFACRQAGREKECSWIYWGGPEGYSTERRTALPSHRASDIAVADFDGDGRLEVAVCQPYNEDWFTVKLPIYRVENRRVSLWRELEAHDPRRIHALPPQEGQKCASLLVVNRQGRNKLGNVPVSIYLGDRDGYHPDRRIDLPGWGAVAGVTADFNDDGICDVALANAAENSVDRDPGSYVYYQSSKGFPPQPSQILPTKRSHGLACGDLDHDGYLDLVFCGFNNDEIVIIRGGPNGFDLENPIRIKAELDGVTFKEFRFCYVADLNNDGWLDLVVTLIDQSFSLILWGGPEGYSMKRSQKLGVWHGINARAADLDGDGYLDLVVGGHMATPGAPHDSFLYIYWNGPDGLREDRRTLLPCEAANSFSIADFNNDGNLDIFVGSYQQSWKKRDSESFLYWNRGGRGFSASDFTRLFTHSASGDIAADFNEDGWIDLAVANHKHYGDHSGRSQVWWNGPKGFNEERITWLPSNGPHGMGCPGPGNVMTGGPEEFYLSEPHPVETGINAFRVEWEATVPAKTWIKAQMRFAETREALEGAPWIGANGADSWAEQGQAIPVSSHSTGWAQYRLALGATNGLLTPRITEVRIVAG